MKNLMALFGVALLLAGVGCFTNETDTRRTLEAQGFIDIEITGWSPWSCSEDDYTETGFRAVNTKGLIVTGTVCCGLLTKGCTVRF